MKKIVILIVVAMFLLSACAVGTPPTAVSPTAAAFVTPAAGKATPTSGFVTVQKLPGMQALLLRSQPDNKSALTGTVLPGATAKIIGIDASGAWLLLEFKDYSGWAPIEVLDITIEQ
jgi:hypothetical protein